MRSKKLALIALSLLLTGCAGNSSVSESSEVTTSPSATTEKATESTVNESNTIVETTESAVVETTEADDDKKEEEKVLFSVEGGAYIDSVKLELSLPEGKIYYTTDGSDPRISSSRIEYTGEVTLDSLAKAKNVVSAVEPALFDTAHCKFNKKTYELENYLKAPKDSAVDKCHVIKAVGEKPDGSFTALNSQTYFIGSIEDHIDNLAKACEAADSSLAVISLTVNFDDFFDYDKGIYVLGASFEKSFADYVEENGRRCSDDCGRKLLANYSQRGRDWEREVYMDFYEYTPDSCKNVLSQSCGIRIQGNYSRSDVQKGFRLYARNEYGDNRFSYEVFPGLTDIEGKSIDSFKTLVLRNGGNCALTTKFSDTFWQSLVGDLNVSVKKSRPAVVYLNGEYWGLYVLEEDYSDEYFEDHYNVESDDVVLYKGDAESYASGYKLDLGEIPDGEKENYYLKELTDFFKKHKDVKSQKDYDALAALVDVESIRDYFAIESWINNKWDWPGKNWSLWKATTADGEGYADGKWRVCVYDVEFGGVSGSGDCNVNTIKEDNYKPHGLLDFDTKNPVVLCFAYLMTNVSFRNDFYNSLNSLTENQFAYDNANEKLTEFENVYGALLEQFFDRYPNTGSVKDALNGGYASSKCIRDFLKGRPKHIQKMIDYCEKIEGE